MNNHGRTADSGPTTTITRLLFHCEAILRSLHSRGTLTSEALKVFEDLAERIFRSVDRRGGLDRRVHPRTSRDRRCPPLGRAQAELPSVAARDTLGLIQVTLGTRNDRSGQ